MAYTTHNETHAAGLVVRSRDGKEAGKLTGSTRRCQMESCTGLRLGVRWEDGKLSWPCTRGMTFNDQTQEWKID